MTHHKDKDLFIGPQEFVVGYSKAPEQLQTVLGLGYTSFSRYDKHGAKTSNNTHCCIGAHRAMHCATGDDHLDMSTNHAMFHHIRLLPWRNV